MYQKKMLMIYLERTMTKYHLLNVNGNVMRRAQDKGRVRTLLGRRCRFNLWEPNQFGIHKALNMKMRSRNMDQGLSVLYIQSIK